MHVRLLAIAAALPLAACAGREVPESPPPPAEAICNAEAAQGFVGQKVTADLATALRILKASGARTLRWGPPRTAMTMDYRADRVNVMYDDDSIITQISCG